MNMKKDLVAGMLALAAFAPAPAARAATSQNYFVNIYSAAYTKDTSPTESTCANYSAYYCTVGAAKDMFGGKSDVAGITSYLQKNFSAGKDAMADSALYDSWAVDDAVSYALGQYTFEEALSAALSGSEYLAVLFYQNEAFRVFGTANAAVENGHAIFDDQAGAAGSVGAWTDKQQAIPEPASGLLALLGAGLVALRRRRRAKKA